MSDFFRRTTKPRPIIVRIAEKIDRQPGGCWLWTGATNKGKGKGYAVVGIGGGSQKLVYVHVYLYTLFYGPVPDGYEVDHKCQVPQCVKPSHLQAVTPLRNKELVGERITHCKNGHEFNEQNTYRLTAGNGKRQCRPCHAAYEAARRRKKVAV